MKKLFILFFSLLTIISFSQTLEVVYSESRNLSEELENLEIPETEGVNSILIQQLIKEQLDKPIIKDQLDKPTNFKLTSSNGRSVYKTIEQEEDETVGDLSILLINEKEQYYRNFENDNFLHQTNMFSRTFLIEEPIDQFEWDVLDETKVVNGYKCKKAISKKVKGVEAWYTSEVSLNVGPRHFQGLPGLIMQVNTDRLIITALDIKIIEENTVINRPTKGKKMTEEQYNKILDKKMRNQPNSNKNGIEVKVITM